MRDRQRVRYLRINKCIFLQPLFSSQCWNSSESDLIRKNLASVNPDDKWGFLVATRNDSEYFGSGCFTVGLNLVYWAIGSPEIQSCVE